jgi:hypothetical protein
MLWDETRHCLLGEVAFASQGIDHTQIPTHIGFAEYPNRELPPPERYASRRIEQGLMTKAGKQAEVALARAGRRRTRDGLPGFRLGRRSAACRDRPALAGAALPFARSDAGRLRKNPAGLRPHERRGSPCCPAATGGRRSTRSTCSIWIRTSATPGPDAPPVAGSGYSKTTMKLWLAATDAALVHRHFALGLFEGVLTNPSMLAAAKRPAADIMRDLCAATPGPSFVSAQARLRGRPWCRRQAAEWLALGWGDLGIEVPLARDGCAVLHWLRAEGVALRLATAVPATPQLLLATALDGSLGRPLGLRAGKTGRPAPKLAVLTGCRPALDQAGILPRC